ncbi:MAG TPA: alpha/beta hydrolase [Pseudonocardiaceae bacterium]|jgi:pimeloyl-ACP methyl ester carboxylesterase|nr:alpha/beta hydrolase [Pseudonocardiaceae bacterium]
MSDTAAAHRPPIGWFLTEPVRGMLTFSTLPFAARWLRQAPTGDGHGVLVLPGLLADDLSTRTLRAFLSRLGYRVRGWGFGRNIGPTDIVMTGMPRLLAELAERTGGPVSVIGWSLGGVYARELARDHERLVRQVITLGSPFALVDNRQSRADGTYRRRTRRHVDPARLPSRERMRQPVPMPSTAIYSRTDGIVDWRACVDPADATHQNIEVRCGHLGFGVDAATFWVIADRLAQPPGRWAPFEPPPAGRVWYPR